MGWNVVKYVSESSQGSIHGGRKALALRRGGMHMVTLEMLTCMFTFGLLIVAIMSSHQDK